MNARHPDPFQVLISTILSQRTQDQVTYGVADELLNPHPTPAELSKLSVGEIERIIHRVGFPRPKAEAISKICRILLERYHGQVPREMDTLLGLPMVGRKTAGCVIVYGFDGDALPVDTHVHRISNRLGVVRTRTPEETEVALMAIVPKPLWKKVNPLLVQHGQNICRPIGPRCGECPISRYCLFYRNQPRSNAGTSGVRKGSVSKAKKSSGALVPGHDGVSNPGPGKRAMQLTNDGPILLRCLPSDREIVVTHLGAEPHLFQIFNHIERPGSFTAEIHLNVGSHGRLRAGSKGTRIHKSFVWNDCRSPPNYG